MAEGIFQLLKMHQKLSDYLESGKCIDTNTLQKSQLLV